jgi:hypothetical protein
MKLIPENYDVAYVALTTFTFGKETMLYGK